MSFNSKKWKLTVAFLGLLAFSSGASSAQSTSTTTQADGDIYKCVEAHGTLHCKKVEKMVASQ